jgi:pumilio RNA-binding family
LNYGYPTQKNEIIGEIMMIDDQTNESLLALVKDKYGNYVVQKMIEVADHKTKEIIIKRIISSQALKKRDGFCKFK